MLINKGASLQFSINFPCKVPQHYKPIRFQFCSIFLNFAVINSSKLLNYLNIFLFGRFLYNENLTLLLTITYISLQLNIILLSLFYINLTYYNHLFVVMIAFDTFCWMVFIVTITFDVFFPLKLHVGFFTYFLQVSVF